MKTIRMARCGVMKMNYNRINRLGTYLPVSIYNLSLVEVLINGMEHFLYVNRLRDVFAESRF